jgi:sugar lactone lactonase YvrE
MGHLWLAAVAVSLTVLCLSAPAVAQNAFPGTVGRIAFTRTEDGAQVYSIAPDGSGEKQLTDSEENSCCPAWSPDGTGIAFYSDRTGGRIRRAGGWGEPSG